jgi:hypothetical protein
MTSKPTESSSVIRAAHGAVPATACCANCAHFSHAPSDIEAAFPGLLSLGSARSSVRAQDGVCHVHDRYLAASYLCRFHEPALLP